MSALYNSPGSVPSLRPNCNTNVQLAFQEGRWAQVITYAKQQFKGTHDPYYEVSQDPNMQLQRCGSEKQRSTPKSCLISHHPVIVTWLGPLPALAACFIFQGITGLWPTPSRHYTCQSFLYSSRVRQIKELLTFKPGYRGCCSHTTGLTYRPASSPHDCGEDPCGG